MWERSRFGRIAIFLHAWPGTFNLISCSTSINITKEQEMRNTSNKMERAFVLSAKRTQLDRRRETETHRLLCLCGHSGVRTALLTAGNLFNLRTAFGERDGEEVEGVRGLMQMCAGEVTVAIAGRRKVTSFSSEHCKASKQGGIERRGKVFVNSLIRFGFGKVMSRLLSIWPLKFFRCINFTHTVVQLKFLVSVFPSSLSPFLSSNLKWWRVPVWGRGFGGLKWLDSDLG